MKKPLAIALAALALSLLTACGGASAAGAAGTYQLDKAALKQAALAEVPAAEKDSPAAKMMGEMFDKMDITLDLKADGSATMTSKGMGADSTETGTWKLEGDKLTMTKKEGGKEESQTGTYANGTLTMEMAEDGQKMKMVFKRK
jgi:hypothetical protein